MSKIQHLKYYELAIQPYLTSSKISTRMKKCLFQFRTRMTSVGYNYGNKVVCPLCLLGKDDQEHLFKCIIMKINSKEIFNITDEKYQDIYSMDIDKLINISKICESAIRTRSKLT